MLVIIANFDQPCILLSPLIYRSLYEYGRGVEIVGSMTTRPVKRRLSATFALKKSRVHCTLQCQNILNIPLGGHCSTSHVLPRLTAAVSFALCGKTRYRPEPLRIACCTFEWKLTLVNTLGIQGHFSSFIAQEIVWRSLVNLIPRPILLTIPSFYRPCFFKLYVLIEGKEGLRK